jgi:hypothetical protein
VLTVKISPEKKIIDYAVDFNLNLVLVLTKCGSLYTFDLNNGLRLSQTKLENHLETGTFEAWSLASFTPDDDKIKFLDPKKSYFAIGLKFEAGHNVTFLGEIYEVPSAFSNDEVETVVNILSQFRVSGSFTFYELIFDYMVVDEIQVPVVLCFSERAPVRVLVLTVENGKYLRSMSNVFHIEGVDLGTDMSEQDIKLKSSLCSPFKS